MQRCDLIGHNYDWVLFDLPQRLPGHRAVVSEANRADVLIDLATPDPGAMCCYSSAHARMRISC